MKDIIVVTGGAGFVDQAVENRNIMENNQKPISYGGQTIDNSQILEDMKVIESLNKYR